MNSHEFAVWLYGSQARGDEDHASDTDILVISNFAINSTSVESHLPASLCPVSISRYSWSELKGMITYGSLFLHHVRMEGRPMYESSACQGLLATLLDGLGDYEYAERDLQGFSVVINDAKESLDDGGTVLFELAVLGTVIRHCSILGCWLLEQPSFGRIEPVQRIVNLLRLPEVIYSEFQSLYRCRLYCANRLELPDALTIPDPYEWINRAERIIERVGGLASANS